MKKLILLTIIIIALLKTESYSCTIVMVSDSKVTLASSNEDSTFPLTILWFVPASKDNYGRICLGYKIMVNTVLDVLNATHNQNKYSSTVYSFICDLQKGEIYVYNYYDFSKPLKFNLKEELGKGNKEYYLSNLFTEKSEEYKKFIAEGPANMIEFGYNRINKMTAMMFFNMLKFQYPKAYNRNIDINALSQLGVRLTKEGKLEDAIMFLEKNITEFPDSARSHLELAQAYRKNNNKKKSIAEYKKILEINPNHSIAKQEIERLEMVKEK